MTRPALHVVVFSNFEGFCRDPAAARRTAEGFDEISDRFPEARWTHMFNPRHLVGSDAYGRCGEELVPRLRGEIGLHLHMFYDMTRALGVEPRGSPFAGAPGGDCGRPRGLEGEGYDVLLTGYSPEQREALLRGSVDAFLRAGLPRPLSFCAGYSAADTALQAQLEAMGFTTSFAAQIVPAGVEGVSYPPCWYRQLEWGENLTPLARPYRVGRDTLLPVPEGPHLRRLIEVPLNTDTDVRPPHYRGKPVTRRWIIDAHRDAVRAEGRSSCVALGVHDVYLGEEGRRRAVIEEMLGNLGHLRELAAKADIPVRFSTAAEVSESLHAGEEPW